MRIGMVKILLLVGNYLPGFKSGGALRSTVNMVERLGNEFEFWIVTSDRDIGDTSGYIGVDKNKWTEVGKAKVFYVSPEESTISNISKIINNTEHDILYLNSFFNPIFTIYPLIARRFNRIPNKPVIVATRGEFAKGALSIKKWKKAIYIAFSNVLKLYEKVFWQASSEFEAIDIRRAMKKYSPKVYVAPNIPKYLDRKVSNINIRKKNDPLRFFIQNLRDEAHRFAIGVHRNKRNKNLFFNPLDEINGIGQKRKQNLLNYFGSAKAVKKASLTDLLKVPNLNKKTAQTIYNFFNDS